MLWLVPVTLLNHHPCLCHQNSKVASDRNLNSESIQQIMSFPLLENFRPIRFGFHMSTLGLVSLL